MASLLEFLNGGVAPGGLLGGLRPAAAPDAGGDRIGDRLGNFLSNNPVMLMALGGGIAQGGIGRGLQMAVPAAQTERLQQQQNQGQAATYQALRQSGVPHGQALAGALNPEVLKTIARSRFGALPTFGVVGHDERGRPTYGFVDLTAKSVTPYKVESPAAPASREISSLDTIIAHLATLMKEAGEEGREASAPFPDLGAGLGGIPKNAGAFFGAPGPAPAPTKEGAPVVAAANIARARAAVGEEIGSLLHSTGMSESEFNAWKDKLGSASSPAALKAAIGHGVELIGTRLATLQDQYRSATGRSTPEWLSPRARARLASLRDWTQAGTADRVTPVA